MRRIILSIVVFYLIALALLDAIAYHGRYQRMVWNSANDHAQRSYYEVRVLLDRAGIGSTNAAARR
jgi:hypothetical protein